jgi:hypothetical protein
MFSRQRLVRTEMVDEAVCRTKANVTTSLSVLQSSQREEAMSENNRFYPSNDTRGRHVTLNLRLCFFFKTQSSLDRTDTERSVLPGITRKCNLRSKI